MTFTIHPSPLTIRYPLTVIHDPWLIEDGKCLVNSKWLMVNGATEGSVR